MVTRDTMVMAASFLAEDQFKGFSGSSGPLQSMMFGSCGAFSSVGKSRALLMRTGWLCKAWLFAEWPWWLVSVE